MINLPIEFAQFCSKKSDRCFINIYEGTTDDVVVLIPGGGGNPLPLQHLANVLSSSDFSVFFLVQRAWNGYFPPHVDLTGFEKQFDQLLESISPPRKIHLIGFCYGGLIAYHLMNRSPEPGRLFVIETNLPAGNNSRKTSSTGKKLQKILFNPNLLKNKFENRSRMRKKRREDKSLQSKLGNGEMIPFAHREKWIQYYDILSEKKIKLSQSNLSVELIWSENDPPWGEIDYSSFDPRPRLFDPDKALKGWKKLSPNSNLEIFPGDHLSMLLKPTIDEVGRFIISKILTHSD